MPTKLIIIHANDLIRATAHGTLEFEETKKMLLEIALAAGPLTDYEILLDTRSVGSHLSTADIWHLAAELANLGAVFNRKTAVLCPPERVDDADFLAMCAQNRGVNVRRFLSFEDAMTWLTETSDPTHLADRPPSG